MGITVVPPHTTLLSKTESLKCISEDFKVSVIRDMKIVLKDKLDAGDIGGPGFIQANIILFKLDEIITHNKFTTNQSIDERAENALHLIEYIVSSENHILILFEKEIDNGYCGAIG